MTGAAALTLPAAGAARKTALTAPESPSKADAALLDAIDRVIACRMAYDEAEQAHEAAEQSLPAWVRDGLDLGYMAVPNRLGDRIREAYEGTSAKAALERCNGAGEALLQAEKAALRIPARTAYGLYAKVALVVL